MHALRCAPLHTPEARPSARRARTTRPWCPRRTPRGCRTPAWAAAARARPPASAGLRGAGAGGAGRAGRVSAQTAAAAQHQPQRAHPRQRAPACCGPTPGAGCPRPRTPPPSPLLPAPAPPPLTVHLQAPRVHHGLAAACQVVHGGLDVADLVLGGQTGGGGRGRALRACMRAHATRGPCPSAPCARTAAPCSGPRAPSASAPRA